MGLGCHRSRGVSPPLFNSHIMQLSELGPGRRPIKIKSYSLGPEEVSQGADGQAGHLGAEVGDLGER